MLSIITITYKDPHGLKSTLASLEPLKSGRVPFEHIIIDSSPEENHAMITDQKRVITPALGVYAAMNTGLSHASGEFVWFLNGGDRLTDQTSLLSALNELRGHTDLGFVWGAAELHRAGVFLYKRQPASTLLSGIRGSNRICHQAVLYRRSALLKAGLFSTSYPLAADYEHLWRCYLNGIKGSAIDACFVAYDMSGASSRYHEVFEEFRQIHKLIQPKLSASMNAANALVRSLDYMRVKSFKALGKQPLGDLLKRAWYSFH